METSYRTDLQEKLERYLKEEKLSQNRAAPILGISTSALSQYRRSSYEGDVESIENRLEEFFRIREEREENRRKAESYQPGETLQNGYVPTSISEAAYKLIRYCQLEKGIVVIDGDAGIGKTKAAAKYLADNPTAAVYVKASPSTSSVRSLLKLIARGLKLPENQRTEDLAGSIQEQLRQTDRVLIIDEAQNLKFMALEEIRGWVDEDAMSGRAGVGIVLIGNVEIYNKMLGRQEAVFAQQFNRVRFHGRYSTMDIKLTDIEKFFPALKEKLMEKELSFLHAISRSKWGIRGMVSVFNNAVRAEDVSLRGLELMAGSMGIRYV